jgi:hypothetical protein
MQERDIHDEVNSLVEAAVLSDNEIEYRLAAIGGHLPVETQAKASLCKILFWIECRLKLSDGHPSLREVCDILFDSSASDEEPFSTLDRGFHNPAVDPTDSIDDALADAIAAGR